MGRFSPNDAAELGWPAGESEEYETIAGFVLDLANHSLCPGEVLYMATYSRAVDASPSSFLLRVIAPEPQQTQNPEPSAKNSDIRK